jgi:hypothetical protein
MFEILSLRTVDWHPLWANWVKGGVCGHGQKSEAHVLGCRPRGESSRWSSKLPQIYRIVPAWKIQWNSKEMEAMWDCASQLWVPSRSRVHGRLYLNFCPITLQHFSFRSWWVCRWMPICKRSRLVPILSGWGHWVMGIGGGGSRAPKPKNRVDVHFFGASCCKPNLNNVKRTRRSTCHPARFRCLGGTWESKGKRCWCRSARFRCLGSI